ncbi:MAG: DUF2505 family protein [Polyangiaceae bacterium]|nr:DUF2505 family protein [Polyangiaceae bacterium]
MAEITLTHEFETTPEIFWEKMFFDETWNKRFYLEVLKFPGWRLDWERTEGSLRKRRVHIDPPLTNLPGAIKRVIGDRFSYAEDGSFDAAANNYDFVVTPSTLPEKTKSRGHVRLQKVGDNKIIRTTYLSCEVKVMMVGGMVEEKILTDFRQSTESAAAFTRETLRSLGQ